MSTSKRGFTLIELLVVIAIIGILSSVVLASLNSARQKSRDSRRVADVKQLQNALELYYDSNASYPTGTTPALLTAALVPTYIAAVPKDPQNNDYVYVPLDTSAVASAASCVSSSSVKCSSYILVATLEDSSNPAFANDVDGTPGPSGSTTDCADANRKFCARP